MQPSHTPTIASLMGYRRVVKPGGASNFNVIKQLNAQRGGSFSDSEISRSAGYFVVIPPTQGGNLCGPWGPDERTPTQRSKLEAYKSLGRACVEPD
jgi:hypothetical protein